LNLFIYRYKKWLPDNVGKRHDTKTTYHVEIRYANNTNETFNFHGPPGNERTTESYFRMSSLYLFSSFNFIMQLLMNILDLYNGLDLILIVADQIDGL